MVGGVRKHRYLLADPNSQFRIMTSRDGLHWDVRPSPGGLYLEEVVWGGGVILATGLQFRPNTTVTKQIIRSTDGVHWELVHTMHYPPTLVYGNGKFVVVSVNEVATSRDGKRWGLVGTIGP